MNYSNPAPGCQAGAHTESPDDTEFDGDLAKFIAALPTGFPRVEAPIVEPIDTGKFATTAVPANTSEAPKSRHSAPHHIDAPVTGTAHPQSPCIPTAPNPSRPIAPATQPKTKSSKRESTKPKWRKLGELGKLQAGIEAAGRQGGLAWSLNLGIGRESALLNSDDPARLLSNNISREFRRAVGHDLPYSFILELCRDNQGFERLHAHGVVVLGTVDSVRVREALTRAGGEIEDRGWAKKQLELKPIIGAAGWTSYITKMRRWGKAVPANRHVFISRQLKQIARQDYDEFGLSKKLSFTKPRRARRAQAAR
ncbi:hypothetical protein [Mesorhizobium sp. M0800]|uniref:hypothetical protein n=1 Tax=Mesorhizobium sp. M0800 TaxID=2957000 RepID=UPI00333C9ADE